MFNIGDIIIPREEREKDILLQFGKENVFIADARKGLKLAMRHGDGFCAEALEGNILHSNAGCRSCNRNNRWYVYLDSYGDLFTIVGHQEIIIPTYNRIANLDS